MPVTLPGRLRQVARRLRRAYGEPPPPRRLPPLDELVLTILSQNTNDTNRDRAYADLRAKLPSWDDVADAPLPVIERAIRSGGLAPTKAPRIRAQELLQEALGPDEMYEVHMNLIRHGRHVCVALRPICSQCVLADICPKIGVTQRR